jgi:hypothetical protein
VQQSPGSLRQQPREIRRQAWPYLSASSGLQGGFGLGLAAACQLRQRAVARWVGLPGESRLHIRTLRRSVLTIRSAGRFLGCRRGSM